MERAVPSVYAIASEMLGDTKLTSGQVAELRAIDRKFQQRLFTLVRETGPGDSRGAPHGNIEREPTPDELAWLEQAIRSDILAMLTNEQLVALDRPDV